MTLEVYRYLEGSDKCDGYFDVEPGDYRTLINVNIQGEDEVIVFHCRKDNKLSVAYTIHPLTILYEGLPPLVLFDKKDTENRALRIKPGAEEIIRVRERVQEGSGFKTVRYRLTHR
ncbi:MAG: hypothetical protein A2171_02780 [Candidatus Levybacteria bacterium RBG_13_35_9]|nr:MAG: hypothetical protein A2171_02780 [Candidatus Levybacteria bacterium RBG_13_35_9]